MKEKLDRDGLCQRRAHYSRSGSQIQRHARNTMVARLHQPALPWHAIRNLFSFASSTSLPALTEHIPVSCSHGGPLVADSFAATTSRQTSALLLVCLSLTKVEQAKGGHKGRLLPKRSLTSAVGRGRQGCHRGLRHWLDKDSLVR